MSERSRRDLSLASSVRDHAALVDRTKRLRDRLTPGDHPLTAQHGFRIEALTEDERALPDSELLAAIEAAHGEMNAGPGAQRVRDVERLTGRKAVGR